MSHQIPSGIILHHRYRTVSVIGQGGFGITYLCRDERLQRMVCIKEFFLSGHCTRGSGQTVITQGLNAGDFAHFRARFSEEARALARFRHPGIVQVLDVFEEHNTAYYAMDYVEGETLKALVQRKGPLPMTEAMPFMHKLLDAVETVHTADLLHRDIKPDNIIVRADGQPVLIDFGNARHFSEGRTLSQTAILTPGYAPPEQYTERARRGPYTDVYGLGATLYFALTGMKPLAVTDRQMEQLKAPHQLFTDIPETLSSAVMLAMNINPEDRFQDIPAFKNALTSTQNTISRKGNWQFIFGTGETIGKKIMSSSKMVILMLVFLLVGAVAYSFMKKTKQFPHALASSEHVVRSFYSCYDRALNRNSRKTCVHDFFSDSYLISTDAKNIIKEPYDMKEHTINDIKLQRDLEGKRVLAMKYDFTFKIGYRQEKQKDGLIEITLDRENRIHKIKIIRKPQSVKTATGQGRYY